MDENSIGFRAAGLAPTRKFDGGTQLELLNDTEVSNGLRKCFGIRLESKGIWDPQLDQNVNVLLFPLNGDLMIQKSGEEKIICQATMGLLGNQSNVSKILCEISNRNQDNLDLLVFVFSDLGIDDSISRLDLNVRNSFENSTFSSDQMAIQMAFFNQRVEFVYKRKISQSSVLFYNISGVFEINGRLLTEGDLIYRMTGTEIEIENFQLEGALMAIEIFRVRHTH